MAYIVVDAPEHSFDVATLNFLQGTQLLVLLARAGLPVEVSLGKVPDIDYIPSRHHARKSKDIFQFPDIPCPCLPSEDDLGFPGNAAKPFPVLCRVTLDKIPLE